MPAVENDRPNNAERSLSICYLFESEILVWLLLRNWNHPFADDLEYRNGLLESATEMLTAASAQENQESFIQGVPDCDLNFIAAVWYAEFVAVQDSAADQSNVAKKRRRWLTDVKQTLPSCFCATDDLGPN
jgi:hypothetical protein